MSKLYAVALVCTPSACLQWSLPTADEPNNAVASLGPPVITVTGTSEPAESNA